MSKIGIYLFCYVFLVMIEILHDYFMYNVTFYSETEMEILSQA